MNHTKKFLVVPYVNNLEKPSDGLLQNLDKNMSDIINDKNLAPDQKLKFYSKNLNNFLLKYDPDSFGMAPTLTKLAEVVTKFVKSNNDPRTIDEDLKKNLFENPESERSILETDSILNNSRTDETSEEERENIFDENKTANDTILNSNLNNSSINYPPETRPSNNTRKKGPATHPEGLAPNQNFIRNLYRVSQKNPSNFLEEKNVTNRKNKFKNKSLNSSSKSNSSQNKQNGSGIWKTKRFF